MNHLLELDTAHREYLLEEFLFEIHLDHSIYVQEQRLLQEVAEVLEINESRCKELEEKVLTLSHFETEHLDFIAQSSRDAATKISQEPNYTIKNNLSPEAWMNSSASVGILQLGCLIVREQ